MGYSPWGCIESKMTERLHLLFTFFTVKLNRLSKADPLHDVGRLI